MGNFTLRTDEVTDKKIREALDYMGISTVSRGVLHAVMMYKSDQETIKQLTKELEKERSKSREKSAAIGDFELSLSRMLSLK